MCFRKFNKFFLNIKFMTIDEQLKSQGYKPIATFHRLDLFDKVRDDIGADVLQDMDYFIIPVNIALDQQSPGPFYDGMHYIYARNIYNFVQFLLKD